MNPNEIETVNSDNTNESDINKLPKLIRQILFMGFGSLLSVLLLIDITSGILGGLGVISFLSFLLIPALFAFPIIIKKSKLLIIPSVLFPLSFIIISITIFHPDESLGIIQFFCLASSLIAAFGIVAGFLIRLFRSRKSKMKIILITVGGLVLLTPVLFIGYMSAGAPFHSMLVNKIIREYVDRTYSEFDVVVSRTWYDWYDGKYVTNIYDRNDEDIFFEVWYSDRGITDRYKYGYSWEKKNRKNTDSIN
ncbi:MAG: hypothetical protein FWC09_06155 [Lachnospiraceae bacterium]|nr:hypothetical protein [Lachnospiraceae bacterium]